MPTIPSPDRHRFLPALAAPDIAAIDPASAIVVLPIGAIEQHGPHLPIFTDCLTAEAVLSATLAELGDLHNVWALPLLPYAKSNEHIHFAGTITLSAETLARVLREIGASLARSGFRKLVLLNGHGGNVPTLEATARDIRVETGMLVFVTGTGLRAGIPPGALDPTEERWGLHAGVAETSAMMALAPAAVQVEKMAGDVPRFLADFSLVGPTRGTVTSAWLAEDLGANGVIGNPAGATAELGRLAVAGAIGFLTAVFAEVARFEYPASAPTGQDGRLR